ncbi:MAG: hypothetical protein AVDCRST_MAG64-4169 [uncultured Phycisphaerae bacterium]|uniref:Uncharacterized protein n=1 Tax=uncultured Phycisphaerae bacterium TaxID=904963 RepID=A0A6J4QG96_9BACT|nr:MAG: hypothetical protein AVDCRST_MAG64-4169 [uncultured Phycisphaerae bacterium]
MREEPFLRPAGAGSFARLVPRVPPRRLRRRRSTRGYNPRPLPGPSHCASQTAAPAEPLLAGSISRSWLVEDVNAKGKVICRPDPRPRPGELGFCALTGAVPATSARPGGARARSRSIHAFYTIRDPHRGLQPARPGLGSGVEYEDRYITGRSNTWSTPAEIPVPARTGVLA